MKKMNKVMTLVLNMALIASLLGGCGNGSVSAEVGNHTESATVETDNHTESVSAVEKNIPKYIFYFIGDGMGSAHRSLAEYYLQWKKEDPDYALAMNDMPISTNTSTNSLSSMVTDSAAAGTALSTGKKTARGVIGMNEDASESYTTILEALQQKDMSVGLVTTVNITHATPAAFGAHVADRNEELTIAEQYLEAEYDYLAGGGRQYFLPKEDGGKRKEGDSLVEAFKEKGYEVDTDLDDYNDTDFSGIGKYLGIYEEKYLTDEITQINTERTSPTLAQMTKGGIDVLSKNENGFFMMVEGGYIDGAAHNNDTACVLHEVLAFDEAVETAIDFYNKHPDDTLILVTSDHETGGLSLGYNSYSMNFEALDAVTVSFGKAIEPYINAKDYDGFYAAIEEHWNLTLSEDDKTEIYNRIQNFPVVNLASELGFTEEEIKGFDGMNHMIGIAGYAAAPVLSRETNIGWATQAHTAETVPLTVKGVGCDKFIDCKDNTDIPNTLADLMGVEIG